LFVSNNIFHKYKYGLKNTGLDDPDLIGLGATKHHEGLVTVLKFYREM